MNTDERTTPIGLARFARQYQRAAIAADDVIGHDKGYETIAPPPVMFLIAHAIELALKSYLLHTGLTLKDTIRLGHNLKKCWQVSMDRGIACNLTLSETDQEVLALISELHDSTELRYIRTGPKEYPVFGPLEQLAEKILDVVCPLVGFK